MARGAKTEHFLEERRSIVSEITNRPSRVNSEAIDEIRKKFINTLDREDLHVPVNIGTLARRTRRWAHITPRNNQPYFEQYILKELEDQGYCKIKPEKREVIFLKLPK